MAERQLPKLDTRVRFPSPAKLFILSLYDESPPLEYLCKGKADDERVFKIADAKKALARISFANLPLAVDDVLVSH
jgi:hypothetical protein